MDMDVFLLIYVFFSIFQQYFIVFSVQVFHFCAVRNLASSKGRSGLSLPQLLGDDLHTLAISQETVV